MLIALYKLDSETDIVCDIHNETNAGIGKIHFFKMYLFFSGGEGLVGGGGGSERTMAHMSMATKQYLEKHNLIQAPLAVEKGEASRSGDRQEARRNDTERILDVQRLKTLPKLI